MTPKQRRDMSRAIDSTLPTPHRQPPHDQSGGGVAEAMVHLRDSASIDLLITGLVDQLRGGVLENMPDDVKAEAAQQFRKWIGALEWAVSLVEGGTVTDENLAAWLSS